MEVVCYGVLSQENKHTNTPVEYEPVLYAIGGTGIWDVVPICMVQVCVAVLYPSVIR